MEKTGMTDSFLLCVSGCVDSMTVFRKKFPGQSLKQQDLKKAKCDYKDLPMRPFFRQNSVASIQKDDDVWIQRIVQDDPKYECETDSLKETVLDKDRTGIGGIYEQITSTEDHQELLNLENFFVSTNPLDTPLRLSTYGGAEGISENHSLYSNNEQMKCTEYYEMVQIFTPLIVQNVLIHDILPHLSFLDNHDDIYEEMKHHSQKNAVVSLLNELYKSKELGKWQKFMDALNACGYTYIVDNIRGYKFINHRYQAEYIKKITPMIGKMISPPELMPFLVTNELLSNTDKDNILCECNNRGDYAGAVLLLDRLPRKHRNWYMLFIKALEETKYDEVAANLRINCANGCPDTLWRQEAGTILTVESMRSIHVQIQTRILHFNILSIGHLQSHQWVPIDNKPIVSARENYYYLTPQSGNKLDDADVEAPTEKDDCKTKFSKLEKELNKLEQEKKETGFENLLLEKKLDLNDDVINNLKKRRQLLGSIAEKEKERMELHASPVADEENQLNQCFDGEYYFGVDKSRRSLLETTGMVDIMGGVADRPQPHRSFVLDTANMRPPLPVYRLNFDKNYLLSVPIDSGFGFAENGSDFKFAI